MKAVIRDILSHTGTPLASNQFVEFGEGDDRIIVGIRDGEVEVRGMKALRIRPQVSNVIVVETVP